MGIDAEIFVRLKDQPSWLPEEAVLQMAYEMSSTIGPEHIQSQDPPHARQSHRRLRPRPKRLSAPLRAKIETEEDHVERGRHPAISGGALPRDDAGEIWEGDLGCLMILRSFQSNWLTAVS